MSSPEPNFTVDASVYDITVFVRTQSPRSAFGPRQCNHLGLCDPEHLNIHQATSYVGPCMCAEVDTSIWGPSSVHTEHWYKYPALNFITALTLQRYLLASAAQSRDSH